MRVSSRARSTPVRRVGCAAAAVALILASVTVCATLGAVTVSAHRLDEYLQAARIDVEPARLELDLELTPGSAVAESVLADIDRDRDHQLTELEFHNYAADALRAIELTVDGDSVRPRLVAVSHAELDRLRSGEGSIHLQSAIELATQIAGEHQIAFRNDHRRDISVYLANAVVPADDRVAVTAQTREADQSALTIRYRVHAEPRWSPAWTFGIVAVLLGATIRTASAVRRVRLRRTDARSPAHSTASVHPTA